ncbi:MAG: hypothetical protein JW384_00075 [Nitrosomonadaceae bacterium]|nr:hypothetical protein [Nitrosomonadaceae bacterium]
MKTLILSILLLLTGCATVQSWIPSFWDANQSSRITDVQLAVDRLDCAGDQLIQVSRIRDDLRWFELYSTSKGAVQQDVLRLIAPMQATVEDMHKRNTEGQGTQAYCELKRRIMQTQARRAAAGIQGRW